MCGTPRVHGSMCLSNQCGQVGGGLESKSFVKDPTAMLKNMIKKSEYVPKKKLKFHYFGDLQVTF